MTEFSPPGRRDSSEETADMHRWRPSTTTPLECAVPPELGITSEGVTLFDRYMYAMGTSEETMILSLGLNGTPQSAPEIHKAIHTLLPHHPYRPSVRTVRGILDHSLYPPRMVDRLHEEHQTLYGTTEGTEHILKLIARVYLDYSASTGLSMKSVFGTVSTTSGNRAYITRSALLAALLKGPAQKAVLMNRIGIEWAKDTKTLVALRDIGFVEYDSPDKETAGWVTYRATEEFDRIVPPMDLSPLEQNTIDFLRINRVTNSLTILDALGRKESNRSNMERILARFVSLQILEKVGFSGENQSHVAITQTGVEFWQSVLAPVLKACSGDQEGLEYLLVTSKLLDDRDRVAKALDNYYKVAKSHKQKPSAATQVEIIAYLTQHGPTRLRDLTAQFGSSTTNILGGMIAQHRLTKQREGYGVYYFLPGSVLFKMPRNRTIYEYSMPKDFSLVQEKEHRHLENRLGDLDDAEFWEEFVADVQTCEFGPTFGYFLAHFSEQNISSRSDPNEKRIVGKYGSYYALFDSRHETILTVLDEDVLQIGLEGPTKAITALFFSKAPPQAKAVLTRKFPADFGNLFLAEIERQNKVSAGETEMTDLPFDDINTLYTVDLSHHDALATNQEALFAFVEQGQIAHQRLTTEKLPQREQRHLKESVKQAAEARNQIAQAYLKLVVPIAKKYLRQGMALADLVEAGNIGLLEAIESYPGEGPLFEEYTRWRIRDAIRAELNATIDPVKQPAQKRLTTLSLDQPKFDSDGSYTLGDTVESPVDSDPFSVLLQKTDSAFITQAVKSLPAKERMFISLFFNLAGKGERTFEQVRKQMGLNRRDAKELQENALQNLRDYFTEHASDAD